MGETEALIIKGRAVYRFSTGSITIYYIASLYDESWDYSVEPTSFKMKRLSLTPFTLLTCTQTQEVKTRFLHFIKQLYHNGPNHLVIDRDIKETSWEFLLCLAPIAM